MCTATDHDPQAICPLKTARAQDTDSHSSYFVIRNTFRWSRISDILASYLLCIDIRICQWFDTETLVLTPRRSNRSRPRAVNINYAKNNEKNHKLEATRGYNSLRLARRCFTQHPTRQHLPERWKLDTSILPMNMVCMETVQLLHAENTRSQGILKMRDYKQFSTIMSRSDQ